MVPFQVETPGLKIGIWLEIGRIHLTIFSSKTVHPSAVNIINGYKLTVYNNRQ